MNSAVVGPEPMPHILFIGGQGPVGLKESHKHGKLGLPTCFQKLEISMGRCFAFYRHSSEAAMNEFGHSMDIILRLQA